MPSVGEPVQRSWEFLARVVAPHHYQYTRDVAETSPAQHTRVLVVEDDADMRGLIADLLSHEGYRVEEAVTGIDALEKTRSSEHPPDVILLDLNLPMMDGWEF